MYRQQDYFRRNAAAVAVYRTALNVMVLPLCKSFDTQLWFTLQKDNRLN